MATTRAEKRLARVIRHRYLLAHPRCEVRGEWCNGAATEVHHRKRRSQGGPDRDENFVAVCRDCHHLIHERPAWAYENGWLVRSWDSL